MSEERESERRGAVEQRAGLYHRRDLDAVLRQERAGSESHEPIAFALLDVDHWPGIRRRLTESATEWAVRSIRARVRRVIRPDRTAIRMSDSRFLFLRGGCSTLDAWIWAESARRELTCTPVDGVTSMTVSGGVVSVHGQHIMRELIQLAEGALELAQRHGGDCVCTWDRVEVEHQLMIAEQRSDLDPAGRRAVFLDQCAYLLGPTQNHHVTAHCDEVAEVSEDLARVLGLDSRSTARIRLAGLLHDLGKCVIPETLLAKPSSLSIQEWALMAHHVEIGAEFSRRLGLDPETVKFIRHHHTRYDSTSDTVRRQRVPLGPGIISVADAIVTMTSPRSYGLGRSRDEAMAELIRGSGSQFDPRVVTAARQLGARVIRRAA